MQLQGGKGRHSSAAETAPECEKGTRLRIFRVYVEASGLPNSGREGMASEGRQQLQMEGETEERENKLYKTHGSPIFHDEHRRPFRQLNSFSFFKLHFLTWLLYFKTKSYFSFFFTFGHTRLFEIKKKMVSSI